jgi:hypothetical protein
MKYYISSVTIQKGEREYGEQFVVKARNHSEAKHKTEQWYLEWNCYEWMGCKWQNDQLDLMEEIIEFDYAREFRAAIIWYCKNICPLLDEQMSVILSVRGIYRRDRLGLLSGNSLGF